MKNLNLTIITILALSMSVIGQGQDADLLTQHTAQARRTGIVIAAEEVMASVVSITVLQTQTYTSRPMFNPFFEEFFGPVFPREYSREIQGLGSGIIISDDGKVITNAHVVADASNIKVTLNDGRTFDAAVLGADEGLDLALLKLADSPRDLKPADLGNSDDIMIGEWAIALGNPLGFLIADAQPSVTAGVISAVGRRVTGEGRKFSYSGVIQTDAAINPGNSGGPLANILGEVIGINTFIFTQSGGSEGIGFAIPINQVRKFIYELQSHSERRIAWLGIDVQTLTSDMARLLDIPGQQGIVITQVFERTPAQAAGLEEAWVITGANGINYPSESDWQMMEQGLFVDDTVFIQGITVSGDSFSLSLKAAEYLPPTPEKIAYLGIQVVEIDPAIRYRYNIASSEGVVVRTIERSSRGAGLGLMEGDVILVYGQVTTPDIGALERAIEVEADPRTLIIEREGGRYRLYRGY